MMAGWRFTHVVFPLVLLLSCACSRHFSSVPASIYVLRFTAERYSENVGFSLFCHLRADAQYGRALAINHSGMALYYVILLCGDIALNPGPIRWPCTVCGKCVRSNQRALLCDLCDKCSHIPRGSHI